MTAGGRIDTNTQGLAQGYRHTFRLPELLGGLYHSQQSVSFLGKTIGAGLNGGA